MSNAVGDAVLGELRGTGLTSEARALELPEVQTVGPGRTKRPTRKAMLGGLFYVYGSEARLSPPVDWLQDPEESRSWRYELHTLTWLKEALARHAAGGDVETLAVARDLTVDWARAHLRDAAGQAGQADAAGQAGQADAAAQADQAAQAAQADAAAQADRAERREQSEFAWYDMAVGLRAPYIAYVLRACLAERMLDGEDETLLLEAAERHGAELADGSRYAAGNNHGLFQDEGLYLLARLLPALPSAAAWRELALNRMRATLQASVSFDDGAHLEHSVAYQLAMVDLVARLAPNVTELPELGPLLDRMRRTAAWQTTPLGRMAQLGDTDDLPAPQWARRAAGELGGVHFLPEAGQAFVRDGDSYLAVTAAYHGAAHKHADDGGFVLVEDGKVVLGDAGRWGYYEDEPDRRYARSAAAHNVLTVDDRDFEWRDAEPYGSGLASVGEADGWYVIGVRNPLLERQGVLHQRGLFYLPGKALVIMDRVTAERSHAYTRHLHFGPELEVEAEAGHRFAFTARGMAGALIDLTGGTEADLARGRVEPRLGWVYAGDRERSETWTVTLRNTGKDLKLVTAVSMDGRPPAELPGKLERHL